MCSTLVLPASSPKWVWSHNHLRLTHILTLLRTSLLTTHKTLLDSLGQPQNYDPLVSAMSTGFTGQCYHPGKPVQFYLNITKKKKKIQQGGRHYLFYVHIYLFNLLNTYNELGIYISKIKIWPQVAVPKVS